jgi:hypothetical protein
LCIADDITKKWKNIRTIYSRERAKIKDKSGDGVDDVYVPKWVFFKKLEFLRDFVSARTSISNLQDDPPDNQVLEEDIDNDIVDTDIPTIVSTKKPTKVGRKSKKRKTEAMEDELMQLAIESMSKAEPEQPSFDGFDKFGQYIASELRGMLNSQVQGWAKLQIQTILFECQMQQSGLQSPSCSMMHMPLGSPSQRYGGPSHSMPSPSPMPSPAAVSETSFSSTQS